MLIDDLHKSLLEEVEKIEKKIGKEFDDKDDLYSLLPNYISFLNKIPPTNNPKIYFSREIYYTLCSSLVTIQYINILQNIINKMIKGEDLIYYHSRTILKNEDTIAHNWKINHIHLSDKKEETSNFMERSDLILLYTKYKNNIYLIDIVKHPRKSDWFKREYFNIVIDNWSYIYEPFQMRSCTADDAPKRDKTTEFELSKRIIISYEKDNKLYIPPGGGNSTVGSSLKSQMQGDDIIRIVYELQKQIYNPDFYKKLCDDFGLKYNNNPKFDIKIENNQIYLYESKNNFSLILYNIP